MATTEAPITKQEAKPVQNRSAPVVPTVVEKKAEEPPTEQQITEAYLEKRAKGETENLPIPEPAIKEAKQEVAEQTAVDAYLAERSERKRKERGGKAARIDELTREKAELAKGKANAEARAKAAEEAKVALEARPKEEPKPEPKPEVTPKAKPKMNEFTDIDEYHAAMALWAVEQAKPAPVEPAKQPDQAVQIAKIRKEEFDNFLEKGRRFIAGHPDFQQRLNEAEIRGLTITEEARTAITRLAAPEVAYWLASPENDLAARRLMEMDPLMQVSEVGRIAERLKVSPSDFVSNAPQPGIRLSGAEHVHEVPLEQITDTDDYIRRRKLDKAALRRGR